MSGRSSRVRPRKLRKVVDVITYWQNVREFGASGKIDQYRDFRAVLVDGGATQAQCGRVLNTILSHCGVMDTPVPRGLPIDQVTYMNIGKGDVGRWLLDVLTRQPSSDPPAERTETTPPSP